jgi:hypothetical protein
VVQLFRGFGTWPTFEFKGIPEEEQQAFMRSLTTTSGPIAVMKAKEMLQKHEAHESFYEFGGEFLPLSVWASRGFDTKAVQEKSAPEDKSTHLVLGEVYRVKIMKGGQRGSQGSNRTEDLVSSSKRPKLGAPTKQRAGSAKSAPEAPPSPAPTQHYLTGTDSEPEEAEAKVPKGKKNVIESDSDTDDSDSDRGSDTDSSSSESEKKKKNKKKATKQTKKGKNGKQIKKSNKQDKKNKAKAKEKEKEKAKAKAKAEAEKAKADEAKRAEKEKQAAEKQQKAKEKATAALAQQIIGKVTAPLNSLAMAMAKPEAVHLPLVMSDAATSHIQNMQAQLRMAQRSLNDNTIELAVTSIKEITKMLGEVKKTEVIINQLITQVNKMGSR